MGTLFLCAIPGVNLIATICFLIFAKSPSKKSFAWAMLLWTVILLAATTAALLLMPEKMTELADYLRQQAAAVPAALPTVAP